MSNGLDICSSGNVVGLPTLGALHDAPHDDTNDLPAGKLTRCGELYGASAPMQHLFKMIGKVAPTSANVLIVGESGTGKELVASVIHQMSKEKTSPFVALNCGFTGAIRTQKGCFERANGGTLFLDEVTEMPLDMQVKLLRVLETNRFYRIGADEESEVSVRVVAATNRDPAEAVAAGILRSDLYYRLAVFPLNLPSLRERGDDVRLLAKLFLDQLNEEEGSSKTFSRASLRLMGSYVWPGNVRELKNVVHRAFILADRELDIAQAIGPMRASQPECQGDCVTVPLGSKLAEAEQQLICATLDHCGGNKTMTAEVLGVSLKTLYNRLNEYQSKLFLQDAINRPYSIQGRN